MDGMSTGAQNFISATDEITTSLTPFTTQTTLLEGYIKRPSTLMFSDSTITQPAAQLAAINQVTNLAVAQNTQLVCDSAKDQIVDTQADCSSTATLITASTSPKT